jgi:DNA-binding transcriptional LysR family regulator
MSTILALVSAGIGSAVVPASMEALHLANVHMHELLDANGELPGVDVYLVHRKGDASTVLGRIIDIISD